MMTHPNLDPINKFFEAYGQHDLNRIRQVFGWYPRLAYGTPAERAKFEMSGAGYGIHWPDLDEDIGVAGLLLGKKSSESPASFERWFQRRQQAV